MASFTAAPRREDHAKLVLAARGKLFGSWKRSASPCVVYEGLTGRNLGLGGQAFVFSVQKTVFERDHHSPRDAIEDLSRVPSYILPGHLSGVTLRRSPFTAVSNSFGVAEETLVRIDLTLSLFLASYGVG